MRELRVFSREGRAHELGARLYALAYHVGSLSLQDMATAAELPVSEIERIIAEFQAADRRCKANLTARYLRHAA